MRAIGFVFAIWLAVLHSLAVVGGGTAAAQSDDEIDVLSRQAAQLFQARKHDEAMLIAQRALLLGEQRFGPDDVRLDKLLNNVALLHRMQGRYAEAELLYKRVLSIQETALGPDHADISATLDKLSSVFRAQNRDTEAVPFLKRSIAIKAKVLGVDHQDVAATINELAKLYEAQRKYAEAEPLYKQVLAIVEKTRGPDHPDVSAALHKLAMAYQTQKQYVEAETLYKRALAITERGSGPEHPDVRSWLDRLASVYEAQRRYSEVEPLYQRALAIMEKARGPDHREVQGPLNNLAFLYQQQRRYADAEPLFMRALAIREKERGPEDPSVRNPLNNVAALYKRQGRYPEAEPLYRRALALAEKDPGGPENAYVQSALNDLIDVYNEQARYAEAEPLMRRLFAVAEKKYESDPENVVSHMALIAALNRLGKLLQDTNRLAEAEALFRRALASDEKRWGPIDQNVFTDLINLGGLLQETNRLAEAEPLFRRALALAEGYGPNYEQARALNSLGALLRETNRLAEAEALHRRALPLTESFGYDPHVASTLGNLAGLLQDTNRLEEAEALYRRALALNEKSFGPDHPNIAIPLNNLATLLQLQRQYPEAEQLYRRALAIGERSYGPDHPRVATRLGNLADLLHDTDRRADAELLMRRALAIDEKSYGPDHPKVAKSLSNLARLLKDTDRVAEAGRLMQRALAIDERSYGPGHSRVATDLNNLAVLRALEGRWAETVTLYARAKSTLIGRGGVEARDGDLARAMLTQNSWSLRHYARSIYRAAEKSPAAREQGLELAQWALQTDAADALAQMSVRFAKGEGPLVNLVRERQDLIARRQGEDKRLLDAVGRADGPAVAGLRISIADLDKSLQRIDDQLAGEFPEYAGLASPKPLATVDVQALLNADEALVVFLDVRQLGRLPEETLAWVITKKTATWHSVPLGTRSLADSVMALRCGLDHTLWSGDESTERCRAALNASATEARSTPQGLPFDVARAHDLYKALFGAVRDVIKGKQLLIVPSGALTSLPFGVLVTEPPKTAIPTNLSEYRHVAWLGIRQAISVLPSVASLAALRRHAKGSVAPDPFVGYGDPVLVGQPGCARVDVPDKCPDEEVAGSGHVVVRGTKGAPTVANYFREGRANVAEVRKLCPLPDTAHELKCVARSLGARPKDVVLGKDMTEAAVKAAPLKHYRIVHFATHGLLAGETAQFVKARAEPALVMSPPDVATEEDDGLLTASEVAGLKLDADWVVLSACNTAGGDGPGAEALSGLARAFFYAGARALLVSHWPVDSYAATMLTSRTFAELRKSSPIGRSEAFRRATVALISDDERPWAAHPATWAPFIVVGAGADLSPAALLPRTRKSNKALTAKDEWINRAFGKQ